MSASFKRRSVRAIAVVVLLGAILPNVAYIGHWTIGGLNAPVEAADGHADHCHGSSSCADNGGSGLQWWIDSDNGPTLDLGYERASNLLDAPRPLEATPSTLDPPPQYL